MSIEEENKVSCECEYCTKRKWCVKESPALDKCCEDFEEDEKLFND